MSSQAVYGLSIPELLRVLNEKLGLERTRTREICLPPILGSMSSLEAEVESLEAAAHDVLKLIPVLRNLLRPVNRLPSEIISHIALCFLDGDSDTRTMIPLTHVCRYWRESIISTPENWTRISSRSKSLAALSLQRAKAAPLKICLDMNQVGKIPGFSDLITSYIRNAETLRVDSLSTVEELAQTLPNFPRWIPSLRSLTLVSEPGHPDWDWTVEPVGLLSPALTHLSLMYIPLYPPFPHLRTLTDLTLRHYRFNLHLDILLDFLEENRLLERAALNIRFTEPSLRSSRRQVAIRNRLRSLAITSADAMDGIALISNIALQRGAHLEIALYDHNAGLNVVLSVISTVHLSNLQSPTHMEYNPDYRIIRLFGPNGSFSFKAFGLGDPFEGFPPPYLTNFRVFHLIRRTPRSLKDRVTFPPSSLPALETFSIECEIAVSHLFSALFSDPSSSPSLKILAFLDCDIDGGFMEELTRFASDRKKTTSAWLYRVVIVNSKGALPTIPSVDKLGEYVPVVDVRIGTKLPVDLV